MNIVVTERDKKLLRLVACVAIIAIFGQYMIRPAITKHETLQDDYDAAEQKQQEYQTQIATLATIDDIIAQNQAALDTASEKYYKGDLETRQMDDIITGIALQNGLFPQTLTLTEAVPGAVSAYLAEQDQTDASASADSSTDSSSDSDSSDSGDSTDGTASAAPQSTPVNYIYIGTATLSAQGDTAQWLSFLDEVQRKYKGLRVTGFTISDFDYIQNNTQAVSTKLITGTLEIYMCVSDKEADA